MLDFYSFYEAPNVILCYHGILTSLLRGVYTDSVTPEILIEGCLSISKEGGPDSEELLPSTLSSYSF